MCTVGALLSAATSPLPTTWWQSPSALDEASCSISTPAATPTPATADGQQAPGLSSGLSENRSSVAAAGSIESAAAGSNDAGQQCSKGQLFLQQFLDDVGTNVKVTC